MNDIFRLIVESNLFNFAIFMLIIIVIAKKVNIPSLLENLKGQVAEKIHQSEKAKKTALNNLKNAKKEVKNADKESEEILENTKLHAENLKKRILFDSKTRVKELEENSKKILETEEQTINLLLTKTQGQESLKLAQKHITEVLENDMELHKKFIEISIDDIEKAVL